MKVVQLMQKALRPEVVENWDVTAPDPQLLVTLKGWSNTVPVPRHWSQSRKHLQGKCGLDKPPFQLPAFVEATGISELWQKYKDQED